MRTWHTRIFGKQGAVPRHEGAIGKVPPAERRTYGQQANQVKEELTQAYETALAAAKERRSQHSLTSKAST